MRFSALALILCLASPAWAVATDTPSPTDSPTPSVTLTDSPTPTTSPTFTASPTPTVTSTTTPGGGNWSLSIGNPLVYNTTGNTAIWSYTAGEAFSNGLLCFQLPTGLEAPTNGNFFVQPSQSGRLAGPGSANGQAISFTVANLAAGETLQFWYGYNATGFLVNTTITPLGPFILSANPSNVTPGAGVVTPVPLPASIAVLLPTATSTATPTATITTTFTPTPTIPHTFTHTQTYTETPVAAAPSSGTFCYPNPVDFRVTDKVTIRFQPVAEATVQIFNLVGEPVRRLDATDIYPAQGWALWHGEDDHLRRVVGGLYFVRVKTPSGVLIRKFTVLR